MKLLAYRGKGIVSRMIQLQTRSPYSHIALQLDDESVIEAWHVGGVRHNADWTTIHGKGTAVDVFRFNEEALCNFDEKKMLYWLQKQLGKKYDFLSVFRFLSKRKALKNDRWFCSELIEEAIIMGGGRLLRGIPAQHSPRDTVMSPCLIFEETLEW
jgi:uncharacterized protein YycO